MKYYVCTLSQHKFSFSCTLTERIWCGCGRQRHLDSKRNASERNTQMNINPMNVIKTIKKLMIQTMCK